MLVVHFNDFTVVLREHGTRNFQELQNGIDSDTHVGGKYDGNRLGRFRNFLFALRVKAGRANHDADIVSNAEWQIGKRSLGTCEVDQNIGFGKVLNVIRNQNPGRFANCRTGIRADFGNSGGRDGSCEFKVIATENGLNDELAHATGCAGNSDFHGLTPY